jgi:hypothetical protein
MNKNFKIILFVLAITGTAYLLRKEDVIPILSNPRKSKAARIKKKVKKKATKKKKTKTVRVYRNVNTGTLSVQEKTNNGWRVTKHPHRIKLKNAKFKVNQTGRRKVLASKQKNVHAVIEGELVDTKSTISGNKIIYDPYKTSQFMLPSGKKVFQADIVSVDSKGNIRAKGIV